VSIERDGLEAERDFLLRSIADLDDERAAGDIEPDDYTALRDDYVARAADAIRALDGSSDVRTPPTRANVQSSRRAVVAIVASILVAVIAGVALANAVGSRSAGDPLSGSLPTTNADRLRHAEELVQANKILEALKAYDAIIKSDPNNPAALAERGWITHGVPGFEAKALEYIDRAIAADPTYAEAHFFRGMIIWKDSKDPAGAVTEFRLFLANSPDAAQASTVESLLRQAAQEAGIPAE
jgi:tetratricopeptide (TPR) repeat protein